MVHINAIKQRRFGPLLVGGGEGGAVDRAALPRSLCLSLSHTHSLSLSFSLSLSLTHTHTHKNSYSLTYTHSLSVSLSLTHTLWQAGEKAAQSIAQREVAAERLRLATELRELKVVIFDNQFDNQFECVGVGVGV